MTESSDNMEGLASQVESATTGSEIQYESVAESLTSSNLPLKAEDLSQSITSIQVPTTIKDNEVSVSKEKMLPEKKGISFFEQSVRIPNVTLPCSEGVLVDVYPYIPRDVNVDSVSIDYVYGRSEVCDNKIKVFPLEPGDYKIGLTYLYGGERCTTILNMLVNQDPKKLWVKNDPPSGSSFMKDLYSNCYHKDSNVRFAAASRRGRSHEQNGTFRDDDYGFWASPQEDIYLLVVADGAGSAKYSREGSRRAVQTVVEYLSSRLTPDVWGQDEVPECKDDKVAQMLVLAARSALDSLVEFCKTENQKLNAIENYSLKDFNTTLLIAAVKVTPTGGRKIVTFSIGDGAIAWVEPDASELLCAPDGGEFSGQTRFLTTTSVWQKASEDWEAFRASRIFTKLINQNSAQRGFLSLMTDGVSDPFFETDIVLHNKKAWDDFVLNSVDVDEGEDTIKTILNLDGPIVSEALLLWLGFWSRGNHDDRTVAFLLPNKFLGVYGCEEELTGSQFTEQKLI